MKYKNLSRVFSLRVDTLKIYSITIIILIIFNYNRFSYCALRIPFFFPKKITRFMRAAKEIIRIVGSILIIWNEINWPC